MLLFWLAVAALALALAGGLLRLVVGRFLISPLFWLARKIYPPTPPGLKQKPPRPPPDKRPS